MYDKSKSCEIIVFLTGFTTEGSSLATVTDKRTMQENCFFSFKLESTFCVNKDIHRQVHSALHRKTRFIEGNAKSHDLKKLP
jgi:hypothetical protein